MDERRDVALLRYDVTGTQMGAGAVPLVLGDADINDIAKELLALGYSGSGVKSDGQVGSPKANAGILSQITNFGAQSYGRNLEMDAPIDPGDSGGPVLNTAGEGGGHGPRCRAPNSGRRAGGGHLLRGARGRDTGGGGGDQKSLKLGSDWITSRIPSARYIRG